MLHNGILNTVFEARAICFGGEVFVVSKGIQSAEAFHDPPSGLWSLKLEIIGIHGVSYPVPEKAHGVVASRSTIYAGRLSASDVNGDINF
jgi:hypothetical protein